MSSYFFNGDIPKYHHSHKALPFISENSNISTSIVSNTMAHMYKRKLLMNAINQWKNKPYGFQFRHEDIEDELGESTYEDIDKHEDFTNDDIYKMLMDEIFTILEMHNKTITNVEQFEEDVLYYLYTILV